MLYCPKCKKKFKDGLTACPVCGGKLTVITQKKVVAKKVVKVTPSGNEGSKPARKPAAQQPPPSQSGDRPSDGSKQPEDPEEKRRRWLEEQKKIQMELLGLTSSVTTKISDSEETPQEEPAPAPSYAMPEPREPAVQTPPPQPQPATVETAQPKAEEAGKPHVEIKPLGAKTVEAPAQPKAEEAGKPHVEIKPLGAKTVEAPAQPKAGEAGKPRVEIKPLGAKTVEAPAQPPQPQTTETSTAVFALPDALQEKYNKWKSQGYITTRLDKAIETADLSLVESEFNRFDIDVEKLEDAKRQLLQLENRGFDTEVQEIKLLLTDPDKILTIRKKLLDLRTKISQKESGAPDVTAEESSTNIESIKKKVEEYKQMGYETRILEEVIKEGDEILILEEYTAFNDSIKELKTLEDGLKRLKLPGFEAEIEKIEKMLKNPYAVQEIKKRLSRLMLDAEMRAFAENYQNATLDEIKAKIQEWEATGYAIDRLKEAVNSGTDMEKIRDIYRITSENIEKLENLSNRFLLMDPGEKYKSLTSEIEPYLNKPYEVDKLEQKIQELEDRIVRDRDNMLTAVIAEMEKRITHWIEIGFKIESLYSRFKKFKLEVMKWRIGGRNISHLEKLIEEQLKSIWSDFNAVKSKLSLMEDMRVKITPYIDKDPEAKKISDMLKIPEKFDEVRPLAENFINKISEERPEPKPEEEVSPPAQEAPTLAPGGAPETATAVQEESAQASSGETKPAAETTSSQPAPPVAGADSDIPIDQAVANRIKNVTDMDYLFTQGKAKFKDKKYEEAMAYFHRMLEIEPDNKQAKFYKTRIEKLQKTAGKKAEEKAVEQKKKLPFTPDPNCELCHGTGQCHSCHGTGQCTVCNGSGKCSVCGGTGKDASGGECLECGGTGECSWCQGTGKCFYCNGTGYCDKCYSPKKRYEIDLESLLKGDIFSDEDSSPSEEEDITSAPLEEAAEEEEPVEDSSGEEETPSPAPAPAQTAPRLKVKKKLKKKKKIVKK